MYKIYAKAKGCDNRFSVWDKKTYKTRESALNRMKILKKKYGKKGRYNPAFAFDVRKKWGNEDMKKIKFISAEKVNRCKSKWHKSFSIKSARKRAGRKQIYRTPSGVYVWRK